jgi:opacity protein-like surface antigen
MMRRGLTVGTCTMALLLAGSTGVLAQGTTTAPTQGTTTAQTPQTAPDPMMPEPEGLNVTPFLGLGFAGDYENTPATFGVALGYGLTDRVTVEGDFFSAPGGEQGELLEFDSSTWGLGANVLYHFMREDFTPYVSAGAGLLGANADVEDTGIIDDDTSTEFAWNWGGGVKTAMSDRIGLRADLRFFNGDELAPDHWRLYGGVVIRRIGQ